MLIRDRRKEYRDKGYWYWGYVVTGQGAKKDSSLEPLEEMWPYQHFDFRLLVSQTVKKTQCFDIFKTPGLW